MPTWSTLPDQVKVSILRCLTIRELQEAMLVDHHTCKLAAAVRREKLSALTVTDNEELFLSPHAVRWAFSATPRLRMLLQLPSFMPDTVSIGHKIGSGGTNSVFAIQNDPRFVIKDAGAKSGSSPEFNALVRMGSMGLRTVLRDLRFTGGKLQIVMDRITGCIDSKTIVGYQRSLKNYINPELDTPAPNPVYAYRITVDALEQMIEGWELMKRHRTFFGDYQFLLDSEGNVVMNDPTSTLRKDTDDGTQTIIQAMIDTYEFLHADWGTWRDYKRLKLAWSKALTRDFAMGLRGRFRPPDFWIADTSKLLEIPPCAMFRSTIAADVPSFRRYNIGGNEYGYVHFAYVARTRSSLRLESWDLQ